MFVVAIVRPNDNIELLRLVFDFCEILDIYIDLGIRCDFYKNSGDEAADFYE